MTLRARNVNLIKNKSWGIEGIGVIDHKGDLNILQRIVVRENSDGGIRGNDLNIGANSIIKKNKSTGLLAIGDVTAKSIQIKDNHGLGVKASKDITITGNESQINGNQMGGILSEKGDIFISGGKVTINDNQGDGVSATHGNIRFDAAGVNVNNNTGWGVASSNQNAPRYAISFEQHATIKNNKKGGILTNRFVQLTANTNITENGGPGIHAKSGVNARDLWVTGNQGAGIHSGTVMLYGSDNRITGNKGNGITCERLTMEDKGNMIADNTGWGIAGDDLKFFFPINITQNKAGGIEAQSPLSLPENFVVDYNGGTGIKALFGIMARNLKCENNDGDGIWSDGPVELGGSATRLNNNSSNGLYMASSISRFVIQGGQINNNGKYGLVLPKTIYSPRFYQVHFERNTLGAIHYARKADTNHTLHKKTEFQRWNSSLMTGEKLLSNKNRPGIYYCMFNENLGDGVFFTAETDIIVSHSNFINNVGFGINNQSQNHTIMAQHNWWGHANGPDAGDDVSGKVDYAHWLDHPVALSAVAAWDTVYTPAGHSDSVLCTFQNWQELDDVINVSITDELGWLSHTSITLSFKDSTGADSLIHYFVPGNKPIGTQNKFTVTAVSQTDPSQTSVDSFLVQVYSSTLLRIAVSPDTIMLAPGETWLFQAQGLDEHDRSMTVKVNWTATGGQIDSTGRYIAGDTEGIFQVTATEVSGQLTATATVIITQTTNVVNDSSPLMPSAFGLSQNFPNPFNPETVIEFSVKTFCHVLLQVYDIRGREIATLVNDMRKPGRHRVVFMGTKLPSGLYFYRIRMNSFSAVKKMLLLE